MFEVLANKQGYNFRYSETLVEIQKLFIFLKYMKKQLDLVNKFHKKFNVPILSKPSLIPSDRSNLRYSLMDEEVKEYIEGVQNDDLENIAKELCDILYGVYGTILEHGLQDRIEDIFKEVHNSHMSKDYHQYKMIKGEKYFKPNVGKFFKK